MTYATDFPNTENPISEDGHWQNGATNGIDWTDCRTKPGLVFGTESGAGKNQYDDSTSILTGTWGPVQTVQAPYSHRTRAAGASKRWSFGFIAPWSLTARPGMRSSSGLIIQEVMRQSPGGTDPLVVSLTSINSRTLIITEFRPETSSRRPLMKME
jgi:hypothetical protein